MKQLFALAYMDLFKNYYYLEPQMLGIYSMFIWLPWMLKILFGLIGDTVPICGSRKRSWLILMGVVQTLSLTAVTILGSKSTAGYITLLLSLANASGAFMDAIVDALMCIQARKDPVNGSSQLQSLAWVCMATSMIIGGVLAGIFTEKLTPSYCFGLYAVFGLLVAANAILLPQSIEQTDDPDNEVEGAGGRTCC